MSVKIEPNMAEEYRKQLQVEYDRLFAEFSTKTYEGVSSARKEVTSLLDSKGKLMDIKINSQDTGRVLELLIILSVNDGVDKFLKAYTQYSKDLDLARNTVVNKMSMDVLSKLTPENLNLDNGLWDAPAKPGTKKD